MLNSRHSCPLRREGNNKSPDWRWKHQTGRSSDEDPIVGYVMMCSKMNCSERADFDPLIFIGGLH